MTRLITDPVDLALGTDNDLIMPLRRTRGTEGVEQQIRIAIQLLKGEWYLDLNAGVPWLPSVTVGRNDSILGNKYDKAKCLREIRKAIESVGDVVTVLSLDSTFDPATRHVSITWQVKTTFGDTAINTTVKPV